MPGRRPRIAIASDLSLVAETVRTALASRGYDCPLAPWPTAAPRSVDAGLLICELAPGDRMCEALRLVEGSRYPWLLLTGAPPGSAWGAALEGGFAGVVSSSVTLAEVDQALQRLLAGEPMHEPDERAQWIQEWQETRARRQVLARRVQSLTPRERTVLRLLYAGMGVRDIAGSLELSEATVRSHVKSVLRKFRVNSQLDAVAVLGWLRDDPAALSC
jgi:RNA polymerase sigma factor (sigma-70 family)